MSATQKDYHLGTSDEELARLGFQHQVWQDVTHRLWALAGFGPGQVLLDLGAGPGYTTLELARLVGSNGHVHGFEAASRFTRHLQSTVAASGISNVSVEQADVHELPVEDASADGAFARWLMCFVTDPQRVCNEVARVLKPGGVFVLWDYFNYRAVGIFPRRPAIQKLFDAYYQSAIVHGGSYDIAQQLPDMLIRSGFEIRHLEPINRAARPGSNTWAWVSQFTRSYLPKLVDAGLMDQQEVDALKADWRAAEADHATFFFTPPMLGIVACKP